MKSILFLFILILTCPAASWAQGFGPVDQEWRLGGFTVQTSRLPEDDGFGGGLLNLRVVHGREVLVLMEMYPESGLEVSSEKADEPRPGCSSLWVTTYSGGAHCCFEDVVLMACPEGDLLARLALGDSSAGEPTTKGKDTVLPVLDWGLSYYGPPGDTELFIPFAFSPAMGRYLIFEPQGLRPDKPGEYPGFHAGQLAETKKEEVDPEFPGVCLKAAYHAFMVAGDGESAYSSLLGCLPQAWLPYAADILEDVVSVAREFNPVENYYFPKR